MEDFISSYLDYASFSSETPMVFHRWSALTGLGAYLGRQYNLQHGHFNLQPNLYTMIIGTSGTRKSSGIKIMKQLLIKANYLHFSAEKTTKEKFLLDLAGEKDSPKMDESLDDILDNTLWGDDGNVDREMFVAADEFNNFIGVGNLEFISLLGELWDYTGVYRNRIKNGTSVNINNPTISILGGNTPTNFATAFPPEIFGQGFFSRLLLIYGESSGKRIAFPEPPSAEHCESLLRTLADIKRSVGGSAKLTQSAKRLLEKIYLQPSRFDDFRFESFATRRFTHLLKLCLVASASRASTTIEERDVIYANTVLSAAEQFMPKALGEFGKAKDADVTHKVLSLIYNAPSAVTVKEIYKQLSSDIGQISKLGEILMNLSNAEKIQRVETAQHSHAYLPRRKAIAFEDDGTIDWDILTPEEKDMKA